MRVYFKKHNLENMGDIADDAMEKVIDEWANGSLDEKEEDIEEFPPIKGKDLPTNVPPRIVDIQVMVHEEAIKELEGIKRDFIARWEHPDSGLPIEHTLKSETIYHIDCDINQHKEEISKLKK